MTSKTISKFFKKRLTELLGVVFLGTGLFALVSFYSYDPYDPSYNIVSNAMVRNIAGTAGAYFSGPILGFIGLGSVVLVIIPIVWGWKLVRKVWLTKLWLRVSLIAICIPSAAGFFAILDYIMDVPENWSSDSFGGFIGNYIYDHSVPLIGIWGYGVCITIITFSALFFTLEITLKRWGEIYRKVCSILAIPSRIISRIKGKKLSPKKKSSRKITKKSSKKKNVQAEFDLEMHDNYQIPPIDLLTLPPKKLKSGLTENSLSQNAELLEKVLNDFGIKGKIIEISPGPVVTLYALEPSPGTKSSRVIGLADDIARSMSSISARIAVIPGRNAIGIELPNAKRETVYLRELLASEEYKNTKDKLPLALGKDISGESVIVDLAKTPHLLVAGTTGSGKSVGINAMILSLLYKYSPDECKFIMIDPKMLELSVYEDIPHLLTPVVTEPGKAVVALKWTVKEMENRYRLMSTLGVRNIYGYNQKIEEAKKKGTELTRAVQTGFDPDSGKPIIETIQMDMNVLPFIVVVVDEMADLMLVGGKDIETSVQRLAQMARAAGIHIILATQRPSVDVITGIIKANFPTRLSFQVTSKIDSRTILGEQGAEQLLGMGDMLYMAGGNRITRIHGPFVDDGEVEKIVAFLRKQGTPSYIEEVTVEEDDFLADDSPKDELYDQAVSIVYSDGKASTSYIQRTFKIGYNRAANIIEQMEKNGIVSKPDNAGRREIL